MLLPWFEVDCKKFAFRIPAAIAGGMRDQNTSTSRYGFTEPLVIAFYI
jgi:hypothetical protein